MSLPAIVVPGLVPAAGLATTSNVNYSQTIGETSVEIMSSGFILTQSFQQPGMRNISNTQPQGTGVEVYPSPATDNITIKLLGEMPGTLGLGHKYDRHYNQVDNLEFITQYNF